MRFAAFLLAVEVSLVAADSIGFFVNPPAGTDQNDLTTNPVWNQGDTQTIEWVTIFSNWSITLWQQSLSGGSAAEGPGILCKHA
jgi:hypothetical protein